MRDQIDKILRLVVILLAALLLAQLIRAGFRANPLAWVTIPPVPTLATNSISGTNAIAAMKGTNALLVTMPNTNSPKPMAIGTNASPDKTAKASRTNIEAVAVVNTNSMVAKASPQASNALVLTNIISTNLVFTPTNSAVVSTNIVLTTTNSTVVNTNTVAAKVVVPRGTNGLPGTNTNSPVTTKPTNAPNIIPRPGMALAGGMNVGGMPGMPGQAVKLPPEIQARVDKIVDSEMFAPVMHPMPMGLLGIAGDTAFLRSASGQTGLAKVGESVGDIKLLIIGINRVLVEQNGQKKELTIFDGYGSESLLPKESENPK